jgi:uncharacterized YigZ family protein
MELYKTVAETVSVEQVIERSRFIAHIMPVETREAAEGFIQAIRSTHKSATHNVPAYIIGEQGELQWASDDGEPSGTSGAPILHMLVKEGLTNIVVVVTRYFGGTKLGPGGLVRAYTGTVKLALEEAKICAVYDMTSIVVEMDYTFLSKLQNRAGVLEIDIADIIFGEKVTATLIVAKEKIENTKQILIDMTGGTCIILKESKARKMKLI